MAHLNFSSLPPTSLHSSDPPRRLAHDGKDLTPKDYSPTSNYPVSIDQRPFIDSLHFNQAVINRLEVVRRHIIRIPGEHHQAKSTIA